jgi:flagellar biosynthesis component FlhA
MPDNLVSQLTLALSGIVLAMKPDSPTTAIAFIAAAALFGFMQWLDSAKEKKSHDMEKQINDLKTKVDSLLMARGLGR